MISVVLSQNGHIIGFCFVETQIYFTIGHSSCNSTDYNIVVCLHDGHYVKMFNYQWTRQRFLLHKVRSKSHTIFSEI